METWPYTKKVREVCLKKGYWCPLLGPQALACHITMGSRKYREILYGGARGGGKTDWSIAVMAERIPNPHYKGLVLRRNADDLADYSARCEEAYHFASVQVRRNPMVLRFGENSQNTEGAVIRGGHLHDLNSYIKYQGQEFSRIAIEELTQMPSELLYKQIMSSCRSKWPELYPQMILTANPGGVGMGWVKRRFVQPIDFENEDDYTETILDNGDILYENQRYEWWKRKYPWENDQGEKRETIWNEIYDKEEETWRCFIPSTIDDNPILTESDPEYVKMLEGLKTTDKALYNAWRHGDWSVFAGQVFTEFSREKHTINNFADIGTTTEQFNEAVKVISMDWGYSDQTAIYFTALIDDRPVTYKEMYGNKKLASDWGKELYEYLKDSEQIIDYFIYPDDMDAGKNGFESPINDIQEWLEKLPIDKQPIMQMVSREGGSRMIRQQATHKFLQKDPCAKIFKRCTNLIRALPDLVYDDNKPEEINTTTDHEITNPYDGWSYGLRWINEKKKSGEIVHKSVMAHHKERSFVAGEATHKDLGIDPSSIIMNANKKKKDWRTI